MPEIVVHHYGRGPKPTDNWADGERHNLVCVYGENSVEIWKGRLECGCCWEDQVRRRIANNQLDWICHPNAASLTVSGEPLYAGIIHGIKLNANLYDEDIEAIRVAVAHYRGTLMVPTKPFLTVEVV